jgi:hypothetical protein
MRLRLPKFDNFGKATLHFCMFGGGNVHAREP